MVRYRYDFWKYCLRGNTPEVVPKMQSDIAIKKENWVSSYLVSDSTKAALCVADCNSIVVAGKHHSGLSHEFIESSEPEDYLVNMLDDILKYESREDLKAIQIAGDRSHLERISKILDVYEIPVIFTYSDDWQEGKDMTMFDVNKNPKDIIVIPKDRRVLFRRNHGMLWFDKYININI